LTDKIVFEKKNGLNFYKTSRSKSMCGGTVYAYTEGTCYFSKTNLNGVRSERPISLFDERERGGAYRTIFKKASNGGC